MYHGEAEMHRSIRSSSLLVVIVLGIFVACSKEKDFQFRDLKTKLPSIKEANDSFWDMFLEPSKKVSSELIIAVKDGNERLVKEFLDAWRFKSRDDIVFLSLETRDKGWPPLMWAVHYNHIGIAEELLDSGANPDARGDDGLTALALAVRNNNEAMVELLVRHCKAVDTPDNEGMTPLMYAAANNNIDIIRQLKDHHASQNIRSKAGKSAIQIAEELENWKASKVLVGNDGWKRIGAAEGGGDYFFDPYMVRREDANSLSAWVKHNLSSTPSPAEEKVASGKKKDGQKPADSEVPHLLVQVMVQCRTQQIRDLRSIHILANGQWQERKVRTSWETIFPGTVGADLVSAICEAGP